MESLTYYVIWSLTLSASITKISFWVPASVGLSIIKDY